MQTIKSIKSFCCIVCLDNHDVMTSKESNPLFLCSSCTLKDKTRHQIIVPIEGAPAGYVRGSENRCRNTFKSKAWKGE